MTRINCIPVQELTPAHLVAEYRELPRVFALARPAPDAPPEYTLGPGHVKFFYDKLLYLQKRQRALIDEMIRRGMKPSFTNTDELKQRCLDPTLWNDWRPTEKAMKINRARIAERLSGKS